MRALTRAYARSALRRRYASALASLTCPWRLKTLSASTLVPLRFLGFLSCRQHSGELVPLGLQLSAGSQDWDLAITCPRFPTFSVTV